MNIVIRPCRAEDMASVLELLARAELPRAGVGDETQNFWVAHVEGRTVGTVGLEIYDGVGLLRSLAVESDFQTKGVGRRLVDRALQAARDRAVTEVCLLTTTADGYFQRFGFEKVSRRDLDPRLGASEELKGACPESAICMRLFLVESS